MGAIGKWQADGRACSHGCMTLANSSGDIVPVFIKCFFLSFVIHEVILSKVQDVRPDFSRANAVGMIMQCACHLRRIKAEQHPYFAARLRVNHYLLHGNGSKYGKKPA